MTSRTMMAIGQDDADKRTRLQIAELRELLAAATAAGETSEAMLIERHIRDLQQRVSQTDADKKMIEARAENVRAKKKRDEERAAKLRAEAEAMPRGGPGIGGQGLAFESGPPTQMNQPAPESGEDLQKIGAGGLGTVSAPGKQIVEATIENLGRGQTPFGTLSIGLIPGTEALSDLVPEQEPEFGDAYERMSARILANAKMARRIEAAGLDVPDALGPDSEMGRLLKDFHTSYRAKDPEMADWLESIGMFSTMPPGERKTYERDREVNEYPDVERFVRGEFDPDVGQTTLATPLQGAEAPETSPVLKWARTVYGEKKGPPIAEMYREAGKQIEEEAARRSTMPWDHRFVMNLADNMSGLADLVFSTFGYGVQGRTFWEMLRNQQEKVERVIPGAVKMAGYALSQPKKAFESHPLDFLTIWTPIALTGARIVASGAERFLGRRMAGTEVASPKTAERLGIQAENTALASKALYDQWGTMYRAFARAKDFVRGLTQPELRQARGVFESMIVDSGVSAVWAIRAAERLLKQANKVLNPSLVDFIADVAKHDTGLVTGRLEPVAPMALEPPPLLTEGQLEGGRRRYATRLQYDESLRQRMGMDYPEPIGPEPPPRRRFVHVGGEQAAPPPLADPDVPPSIADPIRNKLMSERPMGGYVFGNPDALQPRMPDEAPSVAPAEPVMPRTVEPSPEVAPSAPAPRPEAPVEAPKPVEDVFSGGQPVMYKDKATGEVKPTNRTASPLKIEFDPERDAFRITSQGKKPRVLRHGGTKAGKGVKGEAGSEWFSIADLEREAKRNEGGSALGNAGALVFNDDAVAAFIDKATKMRADALGPSVKRMGVSGEGAGDLAKTIRSPGWHPMLTGWDDPALAKAYKDLQEVGGLKGVMGFHEFVDRAEAWFGEPLRKYLFSLREQGLPFDTYLKQGGATPALLAARLNDFRLQDVSARRRMGAEVPGTATEVTGPPAAVRAQRLAAAIEAEKSKPAMPAAEPVESVAPRPEPTATTGDAMARSQSSRMEIPASEVQALKERVAADRKAKAVEGARGTMADPMVYRFSGLPPQGLRAVGETAPEGALDVSGIADPEPVITREGIDAAFREGGKQGLTNYFADAIPKMEKAKMKHAWDRNAADMESDTRGAVALAADALGGGAAGRPIVGLTEYGLKPNEVRTRGAFMLRDDAVKAATADIADKIGKAMDEIEPGSSQKPENRRYLKQIRRHYVLLDATTANRFGIEGPALVHRKLARRMHAKAAAMRASSADATILNSIGNKLKANRVPGNIASTIKVGVGDAMHIINRYGGDAVAATAGTVLAETVARKTGADMGSMTLPSGKAVPLSDVWKQIEGAFDVDAVRELAESQSAASTQTGPAFGGGTTGRLDPTEYPVLSKVHGIFDGALRGLDTATGNKAIRNASMKAFSKVSNMTKAVIGRNEFARYRTMLDQMDVDADKPATLHIDDDRSVTFRRVADDRWQVKKGSKWVEVKDADTFLNDMAGHAARNEIWRDTIHYGKANLPVDTLNAASVGQALGGVVNWWLRWPMKAGLTGKKGGLMQRAIGGVGSFLDAPGHGKVGAMKVAQNARVAASRAGMASAVSALTDENQDELSLVLSHLPKDQYGRLISKATSPDMNEWVRSLDLQYISPYQPVTQQFRGIASAVDPGPDVEDVYPKFDLPSTSKMTPEQLKAWKRRADMFNRAQSGQRFTMGEVPELVSISVSPMVEMVSGFDTFRAQSGQGADIGTWVRRIAPIFVPGTTAGIVSGAAGAFAEPGSDLERIGGGQKRYMTEGGGGQSPRLIDEDVRRDKWTYFWHKALGMTWSDAHIGEKSRAYLKNVERAARSGVDDLQEKEDRARKAGQDEYADYLHKEWMAANETLDAILRVTSFDLERLEELNLKVAKRRKAAADARRRAGSDISAGRPYTPPPVPTPTAP